MIKNVQPIAGELFSFYVESVSRPHEPHLVDLEFYRWNGGCDCEAFKFRHEPALSRGAAADDKLRCSHIKAARSFFLDDIMPKIAESIRRIARPTSLAIEAQGIVTAIQQAPVGDIDKVSDLFQIRKHIDLTIEQINKEIEK